MIRTKAVGPSAKDGSADVRIWDGNVVECLVRTMGEGAILTGSNYESFIV